MRKKEILEKVQRLEQRVADLEVTRLEERIANLAGASYHRRDDARTYIDNDIFMVKMLLESLKTNIKPNKYICLQDIMTLIPFDIFDLYINGRFYQRGVSKNGLAKIWLNSLYGLHVNTRPLSMVTDIRISLKESLVDIITEV